MSRNKGPNFIDHFLLILVGFCLFGPFIASKFVHSFQEVVVIITPIAGILGGLILGVMLLKRYWSNY